MSSTVLKQLYLLVFSILYDVLALGYKQSLKMPCES